MTHVSAVWMGMGMGMGMVDGTGAGYGAACGDGYWVYGMWLCMAMTILVDTGVYAPYAPCAR